MADSFQEDPTLPPADSFQADTFQPDPATQPMVGRHFGTTLLRAGGKLAHLVAPYVDRLGGQVRLDAGQGLNLLPGPPAVTPEEIQAYQASMKNQAPSWRTMLARKGVPEGPSVAGVTPLQVGGGALDMASDPLLWLGLAGHSAGPMGATKAVSGAAYSHALEPVVDAGLSAGKNADQTLQAYKDLGVWGRQKTWGPTASKNAWKLKNEYDGIINQAGPIDADAALQPSKNVMRDMVNDRLLPQGAENRYNQQLADTYLRNPQASPRMAGKWITQIDSEGIPHGSDAANAAARTGLRSAIQDSISQTVSPAAAERASAINQTRGPYLSTQDTVNRLSGQGADVPRPGSKAILQATGEVPSPRNAASNSLSRVIDWTVGSPSVSSTLGYWGSKATANQQLNAIMDAIAREGINRQGDSK